MTAIGIIAMTVLVIGDSNTEIGHVTGELARLFEQQHGYHGTGYRSLNATVGLGQGYRSGLAITNDAGWQSLTMLWPQPAPKPYLAPDGAWVRSTTPGAQTTVTFTGNGVDVYWLAERDGGAFTASIDGETNQTVETGAAARSVRRTRLTGLPNGSHTLTLTVVRGPVTLLGVDARAGERRAVVHKWGKGWATTKDFLDVDPEVFRSALELIAPEVVVIMLGTNDHNLAHHNRDQFADHLSALVKRVRAALPTARVLLVSTPQIKGTWTNLALQQYLEILPLVAAENSAAFWDMSAWLGPFDPARFMADGIHFNEVGGRLVASELIKQLSRPPEAVTPPAVIHEIGTLPAAAIPVPTHWLAADGIVAVTASNRVVRWHGKNWSAVQPYARFQPRYVADALHGKPVVRFGGREYLRFPEQTDWQTIVFVAKGQGHLFGHPYMNTRPFHPGVARPEKLFSATYAAPALIQGAVFVNGAPLPVGDDAADAVEPPRQAFQVITLAATGRLPAGTLGWGGSWNADRYWTGDLAEVLIYDRALTTDERQRVEHYLQEKYQLP